MFSLLLQGGEQRTLAVWPDNAASGWCQPARVLGGSVGLTRRQSWGTSDRGNEAPPTVKMTISEPVTPRRRAGDRRELYKQTVCPGAQPCEQLSAGMPREAAELGAAVVLWQRGSVCGLVSF